MGRGLAAILPRTEESSENAGLRSLAIELVGSNPNQPRKEFDSEALTALAESIRSRGLLQPIVVRPLAGGRYELIAGERRLRASTMAGLEQIPALVRPTEESERLELALMENVAREDLNPIEEARACATLVEDLGVTKEELGRRIGKSRAAVSNLVRLLALPDEVLAMIEAGNLTEGHGRALLLVKDQQARLRLAREARSRDWSVRETERQAKGAPAGRAAAPRSHGGTVSLHPDLVDALAAAEDALTAALGQEARVKATRDGCRVEVDFARPQQAIELAERLLRRAAVA
jgi:ParB family chromosome partitioning protein